MAAADNSALLRDSKRIPKFRWTESAVKLADAEMWVRRVPLNGPENMECVGVDFGLNEARLDWALIVYRLGVSPTRGSFVLDQAPVSAPPLPGQERQTAASCGRPPRGAGVRFFRR